MFLKLHQKNEKLVLVNTNNITEIQSYPCNNGSAITTIIHTDGTATKVIETLDEIYNQCRSINNGIEIFLKLHLTSGKLVLINQSTITEILSDKNLNGVPHSTICYMDESCTIVRESLDEIFEQHKLS